jgi:hypothetical protein
MPRSVVAVLPWIWTLALAAGVLLLLGLLLWFLPVSIRLRWRQADTAVDWAVWVRVLFWFRVPDRLLHKRLERVQRSVHDQVGRQLRRLLRREPGLNDACRPRYTASTAAGNRPPAPGLFRRMWRIIRWHLLELNVRVGTGDPASSALLVGVLNSSVTPVVASLCARGKWAVALEPEFYRATLTVDLDGIWSFRLGQTMVALLSWWRQQRAQRRTRGDKAQRGTKRCRNIPFKG